MAGAMDAIMSDDRDIPRPGRPSDWLRDQSGEEITDEHTPPPTVVPPDPVDRVKSRRAEATRPARGTPVDDQLRSMRATIDDLWHRDRHHTEANHEVQRALDKLWPLRGTANHVLELSAKVAHLAAFPADVERDVDELRGRVETHGNVLTSLRGLSGSNGEIGELRRSVGRLEETVRSNSTALDGLNRFKWTVAGFCTAASLLGGGLVALLNYLK